MSDISTVLNTTGSYSATLEKLKSGTDDVMHIHKSTDQFIYVLSGSISVYIEDKEELLSARQSIFINAKKKHKVVNFNSEDCEFIMINSRSSK
ncbi:cupin domain-containing protein [Vibrio alginolyticus]